MTAPAEAEEPRPHALTRRVTGFSIIDGDDRSCPARPRGVVRACILALVITLGAPLFAIMLALFGGVAAELFAYGTVWPVQLAFLGGGVVFAGLGLALYGGLYRNRRDDTAVGPPLSVVARCIGAMTAIGAVGAAVIAYIRGQAIYFSTIHSGAAMLVFAFATIALSVVAYSWLRDRRSLRDLGLRPPTAPALIWFVCGCLCATPIVVLAVNDPASMQQLLRPRTAIIFAALIPVILVQAGAEEIACRGWLMTSIAARYGALPGLVWSSLFFGLLHVVPGEGVISFVASVAPRVIVGLALGLLMLRYNSLWAPIGLHVGWNVALFTLVLGSSDEIDILGVLEAGDEPASWSELLAMDYLVPLSGVALTLIAALIVTRKLRGQILHPDSLRASEG